MPDMDVMVLILHGRMNDIMVRASASDMNHKIVKKILEEYTMITANDKLKLCDISYLKYQLLKKHDSYELLEMNDTEFKKEIMEIIGE